MRKINQLMIVSAMLLSTVLYFGCKKDASTGTDGKNAGTSPVARAALGQGAFSLWGTCNGHPYLISGTNGICVTVGNCSSDIDAAQQNGGQTANGFQFNGCFKGGTNASGYSEEAVFLCDNVTQWTGNEMGFVKTLNDNTLKAYIKGG